MTNSVLMFVPYSVRMRAVGYALDRKSWVPVAVKVAREEKRAKIVAAIARRTEILRAFREIPRANVNWYSLVRKEEEAYEARFVAMSEQEWRRWQSNDIRTWRTRVQRVSGRAFWDTIEEQRNPQKVNADVPAVPSPVDALLRERREILEHPQCNGITTPEQQEAAVAEIEAQIQAGSGRWRLGAAKIAEERERMFTLAKRNPDNVRAIQRAWRKAIQRRAIYTLGAQFGIY
jgi:hypothetical protein